MSPKPSLNLSGTVELVLLNIATKPQCMSQKYWRGQSLLSALEYLRIERSQQDRLTFLVFLVFLVSGALDA
jgi:hypothetical protein